MPINERLMRGVTIEMVGEFVQVLVNEGAKKITAIRTVENEFDITSRYDLRNDVPDSPSHG